MTARRQREKIASFETQLERLKEITEKLESGELPLDEALKAYEEGVAISRRLLDQLDSAERRIQMLSGRDGGAGAEPFGDGGRPGGSDAEESDDGS